MDDKRLRYLIDQVKACRATTKEKEEYMQLLYDKGRISKERFDDYKKSRDKDKFVSYCVLAGLGLLGALLVAKLLQKN
jgi:hypothetical protein